MRIQHFLRARSQSKPTPQHRATSTLPHNIVRAHFLATLNFRARFVSPYSQLTTSPKSSPVATLLALRATTELASSSRGTNKTAGWLHQQSSYYSRCTHPQTEDTSSPLPGSVASEGQPAPTFKRVTGDAPQVTAGPVKQVKTGGNLAKSSWLSRRTKNL